MYSTLLHEDPSHFVTLFFLFPISKSIYPSNQGNAQLGSLSSCYRLTAIHGCIQRALHISCEQPYVEDVNARRLMTTGADCFLGGGSFVCDIATQVSDADGGSTVVEAHLNCDLHVPRFRN